MLEMAHPKISQHKEGRTKLIEKEKLSTTQTLVIKCWSRVKVAVESGVEHHYLFDRDPPSISHLKFWAINSGFTFAASTSIRAGWPLSSDFKYPQRMHG